MKNFSIMIAAMAVLAGCGATYDKEFDDKIMFDKDGYLLPGTGQAYRDEMPCLDANRDGRVSRAEWDSFMDYWSKHTPEAGKSMCSQMPKSK